MRPRPASSAGPFAQIATSWQTTVYRRVDGKIFLSGGGFHAEAPPLPSGVTYTDIDYWNGGAICAVRSDGEIVTWDRWGDPWTLPPTLPVGVRYVKAWSGGGLAEYSVFALRTDGQYVPGCDLEVSLDATGLLVGQNHQAKWLLPIPDQASLVGIQFYNQALVLDIAAGNGFGAVVSQAAEGIVEYPRDDPRPIWLEPGEERTC